MDTSVVIKIPLNAVLSGEDLEMVRILHPLYDPMCNDVTITARTNVDRTSVNSSGVSVERLLEFARCHPAWVTWPRREDVLWNISTLEQHLARQHVLLTLIDERTED